MKEQSLKHYDEIKKGKTQFLIRKQNIQTSVSMRSKHNYLSKINQQLNLIRQYEVLFCLLRISWAKSSIFLASSNQRVIVQLYFKQCSIPKRLLSLITQLILADLIFSNKSYISHSIIALAKSLPILLNFISIAPHSSDCRRRVN